MKLWKHLLTKQFHPSHNLLCVGLFNLLSHVQKPSSFFFPRSYVVAQVINDLSFKSVLKTFPSAHLRWRGSRNKFFFHIAIISIIHLPMPTKLLAISTRIGFNACQSNHHPNPSERAQTDASGYLYPLGHTSVIHQRIVIFPASSSTLCKSISFEQQNIWDHQFVNLQHFTLLPFPHLLE